MGSRARFTNGKNRGSRITDIKFSFSRSLRSKCFRGVQEERKTKERDFARARAK